MRPKQRHSTTQPKTDPRSRGFAAIFSACLPRLLAAWVTLAVLAAAGAQVQADEVDDYVNDQMRRRHVPGLALAVMREGKAVKAQGYGLANVELNVPASAETVFEIGSITKQFTAALVLRLVEEGKLGLEDKLNRRLPGVPEGWSGISLRHLLTHTSGLTNYSALPGFEVARKLDVKGFIQALAPHPLLFEPGAAWSYCNSGYNLLGRVVEQAAGQSYWECLRARIFLPLGMSASQSRDQAVVITNRAAGYEWERGRLVNRDSDLTDVFAAGAIVSTITDLAKWNAALDGDKLLCGASREQMWTPVRLNSGKTYPYGFGWRVDDYRGWRCVSHSGSTAGFSSSAQRYPEDKLVVIVLCNLGTENVATQVGRGVAGLYLGAK